MSAEELLRVFVSREGMVVALIYMLPTIIIAVLWAWNDYNSQEAITVLIHECFEIARGASQ